MLFLVVDFHENCDLRGNQHLVSILFRDSIHIHPENHLSSYWSQNTFECNLTFKSLRKLYFMRMKYNFLRIYTSIYLSAMENVLYVSTALLPEREY